MLAKYTSERLLRELPRPLLNFLWYIWDTYRDPNESEFRVTLQDGGADGQRIIVHYAGVTTTHNFGCRINAEIVIRKDGKRCFMEHD